MRYLIVVLALILLSACKHAEPAQIIIRDTIIRIAPPVIIDSGKAQIKIDTILKYIDGAPVIKRDTVIKYVKTKGMDTVIKWLYYPNTQDFSLFVKPDTVESRLRDTASGSARDSPKSTLLTDLSILIAILAIFVLAIFIVLKKR